MRQANTYEINLQNIELYPNMHRFVMLNDVMLNIVFIPCFMLLNTSLKVVPTQKRGGIKTNALGS